MKESISTIRPAWGMRHPASGLLHLSGALLSLAGTLWLLTWTEHPAVALVFGGSMALLYSASSSYHLLQTPEPITRVLRLLDHSMIYVFIAGCYTPFCLLTVPPSLGVPFLAGVWVLGLLGVAMRLFYTGKSRWLRAGLYLAMGWMGVFLFPAIYRSLPAPGFLGLVLGGVAYSTGAIVYALKRPDPFPRVFGYHEIWHLFVLAGSGCHFWAIAWYVMR